MSLRILSARAPAQRAEWLQRWEERGRDVFAHPAFCEAFAQEGEPLAFSWRDAGGEVLFPLVKRPIAHADGGLCDLTTPYGYGGPFGWQRPDAASFWRELERWAQAQHVVSLFSRLSLFEEDLAPFQGEVSVNRPNVVCDLRVPLEHIWRAYDHKVRNNVGRAEREGVRVEPEASTQRLDVFWEVYRSTMERRGSSPSLCFSRDWFADLCAGLSGQYCFFYALHERRAVSVELVLLSRGRAYSFLGGTFADAFPLRPNDALKHAAIQWSVAHHLTHYVLGGGLTPGDGIFRYKRAFAPRGLVDFKVARRVFLPDAYQRLTEQRERDLAAAGAVRSQDFFPAYRG